MVNVKNIAMITDVGKRTFVLNRQIKVDTTVVFTV
uniref:Uncharacterized protein n=1 Tax=uncultured bacterium BLR12 TaxID=506514 RepID=C0IND5_9BACT|nr:hypothetical protein AKSOIL_0206 [uncultured bacterium BLR12]